ncbi:MAG: HAD family hydrolase [Pseudomonadota bacterium]|nr:HAD family hydrolase [Pseudomonadota bacterium]
MNATTDNNLAARFRELSTRLEPRPTDTAPRLGTLSGIRAVLFDIYGTLVISASGDIGLAGEQDEDSAFRTALASVGIQGDDAGPEKLKAAIRAAHVVRKAEGVAYPEVDILAIWSSTLGTKQGLEQLAVEYECRVNPVWPMPGLGEVLAELHHRGLVLGIVSNAQFYTSLMLEAFLERPLPALGFDPDCCAFSYRLLEAKPSTRIYREALVGLEEKHGIEAHEVLYVGNDVRNDIWPASLVGCRTALFAGDARSLRLREDDPQCAGVEADRVVTDLHQIPELV